MLGCGRVAIIGLMPVMAVHSGDAAVTSAVVTLDSETLGSKVRVSSTGTGYADLAVALAVPVPRTPYRAYVKRSYNLFDLIITHWVI